jgi:hypothetical protein
MVKKELLAKVDLNKLARGLSSPSCATAVLDLLDAIFTTEEEYALGDKLERIMRKLCKCSVDVEDVIRTMRDFYKSKGIWHDFMYLYGCGGEEEEY